jgi:hypothetical protein
MAFTQNVAATFAKQPRHGLVQIANADASNQKTVITAGASGSKVTALYASSTDTSARVIAVSIVRSATTYILGSPTVALRAGDTADTPAVDLLNSTVFPAGLLALDNDGQKYLFLESGDTLVVNSQTTLTSGKIISVHADYGDF